MRRDGFKGKIMIQLIRDWILPGAPIGMIKNPDLFPVDDRRQSIKYKRKKSLVRSIWITSGLIMLTFPVLPFVAAMSLLTTFLSFVILDETQ